MKRGGSDPITGPADAVQAKDVVISEIMWGLDERRRFRYDSEQIEQWIELYNSTDDECYGSRQCYCEYGGLDASTLLMTHDTIPTPAKDSCQRLQNRMRKDQR